MHEDPPHKKKKKNGIYDKSLKSYNLMFYPGRTGHTNITLFEVKRRLLLQLK